MSACAPDWSLHDSVSLSLQGDLSAGAALDSFATVGIVHSFVHLYWSGWWSFLDTWLFPASPALSSLASILLGYLGCLLAILLHGVTKLVSRSLQQRDEDQDIARIFFEDVYHVFAGTSVITTWRGFWYGFYVLGDHFPILYKGKDVTSVAAHVISFGLLALANVSTSLCGKGVDIDGNPRDGEGLICSVDYFCEYFKDELDEEEQSRRRNPDLPIFRQRPVAKVTGSQKLAAPGNQDTLNGSPSPGKQRVVQKKVDDDVMTSKRKSDPVGKPPLPVPSGVAARKKKEL